MDITRRSATVGGLSLLTGASMTAMSRAEGGSFLGIGQGLEDFWLATDAYIYGYPLVTMEMTRRVITNVAAPDGTRAPMGQIIKLREYPNSSFRDVTAPNADTLYTTAFFDVGKEPWVLSIPDMNGRYCPDADAGRLDHRVRGARQAHHRHQGRRPMRSPGRAGRARCPPGSSEYKSPTSIVWLLGRIYCTGTPEDYAAVHKLQDEFKLVPLSSYGKPYTPPPGTVDPSIDMKTAVREQVNRMDAAAYFTLLCELMKTNPPTAADAPHIAKFARIGIVPGQDFDASKLKADFIKRVPEVAVDRIMIQFKINKDIKDENGLGVHDQDRHLRHRLSDAGARHGNRARRQPSAGRRLPDVAEGCGRPQVQRREQVRDALRQGPVAAHARLLVADDVRQRIFLREQSDQSLFDQRAAEPEAKSGRVGRSLYPEGFARHGQGSELAAGACR